jgi:hypothetical protein
MAPDQFGTPLDFSSNSTQAITLEFSVNASWVMDNCEFVAFVQDNTTKEILQGSKVAVPELMPLYSYNAGALALSGVPVTNCTGSVAPEITIANQAAESLTSLDINYAVNNGALNTFNWTGDLSYGQTQQVSLPSAAFSLQSNNDLMVYTSNPNGNPDEDPSNDTLTTSFISATEAVPDVYLFIKLDQNPEETTWDLKKSNGDIMFSGGPYSEPDAFIKDTLFIGNTDCYTFTMYDAGGDGLTGVNGGYSLRQSDFSLIYENNDFESDEESMQFAVNFVSVPEISAKDGFTVYPNPFKEYTNVSFTLKEAENVSLKIFNVIGEMVFSSQNEMKGAGSQNLLIDTRNYKPCIYFVNLSIGDQLYSKKISTY